MCIWDSCSACCCSCCFFLLMLSFLLFCCLLFDLILCDYFCKVSTLWGYKWKRWRCVRNNVYAYVYVWLSVVHLDNNVTQQRRQLIIIAKWHCTWKVCSVHVYKSPLFSAQKLTNRNYLPSLKMRCKENYHQLFMNFPLHRIYHQSIYGILYAIENNQQTR